MDPAQASEYAFSWYYDCIASILHINMQFRLCMDNIHVIFRFFRSTNKPTVLHKVQITRKRSGAGALCSIKSLTLYA